MPHVDFGTRWIDAAVPDRWHRVSWIPSTGELYVTDSDETYVRVLAVLRTEGRVAEALTGWATAGSRPAPQPQLLWVERRLSEWRLDGWARDRNGRWGHEAGQT